MGWSESGPVGGHTVQGTMVQSGMGGALMVEARSNDFEAGVLTLEPAPIRTRLHWIVFAAPAAWLALSVPLLLSGMFFEVIGGVTFLYAVAAIASACFNYTSSSFAISGDQLFMKTGFIRRSALEIQLDAIEGLQVQQGFLGRMLGYGSIVLRGNGGWQHRYHRISAPSTFRKRVERRCGTGASR